MKLERWALVAEIVGSATILISVIFVVIELRANTDEIRAANRQSTAARSQELALAAAGDELIGSIDWLEVDKMGLTPGQIRRVRAYLGAATRNAEEAYLQAAEGRLDEDYARTRQGQLLLFMSSELAMDYWRFMKQRNLLHPSFVEWMDQAIASTQTK